MRAFRTLRSSPGFRVFFLAQGLSMAGTWAHLVAQAVLVLELGGTGTDLGIVTACQFAPLIVFGMLGGALADRADKRKILGATYWAMMAQAVLLGVLALTGRATIPVIAVLAVIMGIGTAIDNPARRVVAGELVEPADVGNAMALMSGLQYLMRVVGPALAGVLIATVGVAWCFPVNAISFAGGLLSLRLVKPHVRPAGVPPPLRRHIVDALIYARREPRIARPLLLLGVVSFTAYNWQVLLPLLADQELDGPGSYAVLVSALSAGAVLGSVVVASRVSDASPFLSRSAAALGATCVMVAVAPSRLLVGAAVFMMGVSSSCLLSGTMASLQVRAEPVLRGRVIALTNVVVLGIAPLAGPLAGWISDTAGSRVAFAAGGCMALTAAVLLYRPMARLDGPPAVATTADAQERRPVDVSPRRWSRTKLR